MPASQRAKIAASLTKLNADRGRRLAVSDQLAGRPKRCSLCGEEGHNRKKCPQRPADDGDDDEDAPTAAATPASSTTTTTRSLRCAVCGEVGHNRRSCPSAGGEGRPADTSGRASRFRGVTWSRAHRAWRAQVWDGATNKFVGVFGDEEAAARAYDAAALELRGVGAAARLNFPEEVAPALVPPPPASSSGPPSPPPTPSTFPLPLSASEAVDQAAEAVLRAWREGNVRLRVDFLLPDADADGPGARFIAARDMAEAVLTLVKRADAALSGRLTPRWLDDDVEPTGAWVGDSLAAVLLPTADTVPALQALASEAPSRLLIAFNPSWDGAGPRSRGGGNLVSDFGYGASGAAAEAFAASFHPAACTRRVAVGGDDVRLHAVHGGAWQTHYMWPNGKGHLLIAADASRPTYDRVAALVRRVPGSRSGRPWTARLGGALPRVEEEVVARAAVPPPPPAAATTAPPATPRSFDPASDRFAVDIITGAPVRDVRLDPVLQWARWVGGGEGGRSGERARRPRGDGDDTPPPAKQP